MTSSIFQSTRAYSIAHMLDVQMAQRTAGKSIALGTARRHRMAVYANDLIGIEINQFGVYERAELDVLFDFLTPLRDVLQAGVAFDIGANIGNHALYFADRFLHVHAFEPNPPTFELLEFNTRHVPNVNVHPFGLGDEKGSFSLVEDPGNFGGSSIQVGCSEAVPSTQVQVEVIDALSLDTAGCCFLKIDVEGFEASVIRGGLKLIEGQQPLIVLEQHEKEFRQGSTEAIQLLSKLGYRFCWHQIRNGQTSWVMRRLFDVKEVVFGRVHSIVTADQVPPSTYSMLIAVPERFQAALKLR